jgi:hypothetical protein
MRKAKRSKKLDYGDGFGKRPLPWWERIGLKDSMLQGGQGIAQLEKSLAGLLKDLDFLLIEGGHDQI